MVWKFPRRAAGEQQGSKWNEELTDQMINQVHKRLCQSTYKTDYMGIPQGEAISPYFVMFLDFVFCVLQDWIISFVYVAYMYMKYMEFVSSPAIIITAFLQKKKKKKKKKKMMPVLYGRTYGYRVEFKLTFLLFFKYE